ncbi:nucleoside diphosphate kinase regulator [Colwellia sp. E2M01]|uniref:nucleoside diphosphate kinase regulator n=1 Tax=Colwellia sp. E2M01 TaxID=2841561 RepID=UPI001C07FDD8|nr:nucleoside diphosphate kinase regulator [Colwellia sp. E2M01]MBU2870819.1 nucleoside diphosphate kinase regulator [Colwellia sp. E2M01]
METQPDIIISTTDLAALEDQIEKSNLSHEQVEALEDELARATIVKSKDMPEDVVMIGSQVTFKIVASQKVFTKTLCFAHDVTKFEDSISIFAPIGSALLGLRTGQCIQWQTQQGLQSVEIINVAQL